MRWSHASLGAYSLASGKEDRRPGPDYTVSPTAGSMADDPFQTPDPMPEIAALMTPPSASGRATTNGAQRQVRALAGPVPTPLHGRTTIPAPPASRAAVSGPVHVAPTWGDSWAGRERDSARRAPDRLGSPHPGGLRAMAWPGPAQSCYGAPGRIRIRDYLLRIPIEDGRVAGGCAGAIRMSRPPRLTPRERGVSRARLVVSPTLRRPASCRIGQDGRTLLTIRSTKVGAVCTTQAVGIASQRGLLRFTRGLMAE